MGETVIPDAVGYCPEAASDTSWCRGRTVLDVGRNAVRIECPAVVGGCGIESLNKAAQTALNQGETAQQQ